MIGPSKRTLDNIKGLHPNLIKVLMRAYQIAPLDFGVTAKAVRTLEEQKELYAQGRTKPGSIVTWTIESKHIIQKDGYGHAVDLTAFVDGKPSWNEAIYPAMMEAIKTAAKDLKIKIIWGGCWDRLMNDLGNLAAEKNAYINRRKALGKKASIDMPHIELAEDA